MASGAAPLVLIVQWKISDCLPILTAERCLVAPAKKPPKNPSNSPASNQPAPEPPLGSPEWYEAVEARSDVAGLILFEARLKGKLKGAPKPADKPSAMRKVAAAAKSAAKAVGSPAWLVDVLGSFN
jgi:hypothetical protein